MGVGLTRALLSQEGGGGGRELGSLLPPALIGMFPAHGWPALPALHYPALFCGILTTSALAVGLAPSCKWGPHSRTLMNLGTSDISPMPTTIGWPPTAINC